MKNKVIPTPYLPAMHIHGRQGKPKGLPVNVKSRRNHVPLRDECEKNAPSGCHNMGKPVSVGIPPKAKYKGTTGLPVGCSIKAIILAAGYSKRINLKVPKQLVRVGKKPLLLYALDVFEKCKPIDSIFLVVPRRYFSQCRNLVKRHRFKKIERICLGGTTRQQSVFNALCKIKHCDYVVIHDGVRPFITEKMILKAIKAVQRFDAATCAVKTTDTIVEARKDLIDSVFKRDNLWNIQTPQAFKFDLILQAHQKARQAKIFNASDDAQLILGLKTKVKLIEGSYENIKVTTIADLRLSRLRTSHVKTRQASGCHNMGKPVSVGIAPKGSPLAKYKGTTALPLAVFH